MVTDLNNYRSTIIRVCLLCNTDLRAEKTFAKAFNIYYPIGMMKGTNCLILSSLLLVQVTFGELVNTDLSSAAKTTPTQMSDQQVRAYMDAIVVEKFNIHHADFEKSLNHLDEIIKPHGLQIQFQPHKETKRIVSLKTRDLSMSKNLSYLCRQVGYEWWADGGLIIVGPIGSNEAMITEFIPLNSTTARRLAYRYK